MMPDSDASSTGDFAGDSSTDNVQPLSLDDIVEAFTQELRAGGHPSVTDYVAKHPGFGDELTELLGSVEIIERLKSTAVGPADSKRQKFEPFPMPSTIGEYDVLRELGRGGMGVVFLARHRTLERQVAIKVLPPSLSASADRTDRFHREAKSAAALAHPNIVRVFGVGQEETFHYYVMDYVDGEGLDEVIKKGLPHIENRNQWIAGIGANLADALSHAHEKGLLHRDLKPANFLLSDNQFVQITDFGLAKPTQTDLHLTKTGDLIGTPQYLAPESLEGTYDACSEVYCLGLTLYELVSGQPAFATGSPAEVLRNITTQRPTPLRKIDPRIPVDLATVIEKSINREPAARYATAGDFRDDLRAFATGEAITARRATTWEHAVRWAKANPLAAGLSALSLTLLTLFAIAVSIGYWSTSEALAKLREQQTATAEALDQAQSNQQKTAAESARAEANVAISMEAFDEMFRQMMSQGSIDADLLDTGGLDDLANEQTPLTPADAQFLQKLLGFYQQFARQNADNVDLASELARAYRRMGRIYQLMDEPNEAIEAYQEAVNLYEWLTLTDPDSESAREALFQANEELSALLGN
jgi:serine/threonine protein kinase